MHGQSSFGKSSTDKSVAGENSFQPVRFARVTDKFCASNGLCRDKPQLKNKTVRQHSENPRNYEKKDYRTTFINAIFNFRAKRFQ